MNIMFEFQLILFAHFVGDFILQTDWQAKNKSKNWNALGRHISTYSVVLALGTIPVLGFGAAGLYALVNGALHFLTDAVTSRINSHLYAKGDIHNFFVGIGADQYIHSFTLGITLIAAKGLLQ